MISSACSPLYRSSIAHVPVMKQAGDFQGGMGLETGSTYINAHYAFTDYMYVSASGTFWATDNSNHAGGEAGVSFYQSDESNCLSIGLLGGYGNTNVFNSNWGNPTIWDPTFSQLMNGQYSKFSLQPAYSFFSDRADVTFSFRNTFLYWTQISDGTGDSPGLEYFFEPAVSVRAGSSYVKPFFDFGLQIPIYRSFDHFVVPFHVGLGMDVNLSLIKKKKEEQ